MNYYTQKISPNINSLDDLSSLVSEIEICMNSKLSPKPKPQPKLKINIKNMNFSHLKSKVYDK